eukprot:3276-Heterococcus_DN1.PRE.2
MAEHAPTAETLLLSPEMLAAQGLYIAQSWIPNGGLGLFTSRPRSCNEEICLYTGRALRLGEAL